MKTIYFNPHGEQLCVHIAFGHALTGSYILKLWESINYEKMMQVIGNNNSRGENIYNLPLPTEDNIGRIVECQFTFTNRDIKSGEKYYVALKYSQAGKDIGIVEEEGLLEKQPSYPQIINKLAGDEGIK